MKKIIALILCLMSVVALLCACKPKQTVNSSSKVAESESSAAASEELNSDVVSDKTSSVVDDSSSKKENDKSSSKDSDDKDSSKGPSRNDRTSSVSTSSSVKLPSIGGTVEIGCFQFTPYYCINYGDEEDYVAKNDGNMNVPIEQKLEEFEDVLKEGYFNTVFLNYYDIDNEKLWQIIEKYKVSVWMMIGSGYKSSSGKTIDEWMEGHLSPFKNVRKNPERWALVNGIAYDEMMTRKYTPEDFSLVAEYLYKKLGKRCFPVMAPQEFTTLWPADGPLKQTKEGCKYITDIAFDMYDADVRDNAQPNYTVAEAQLRYPEYNIQNGQDVYRMMTAEMLKLFDHPVNVWFYPSSHARSAMHTESYCLAQLNFFDELLKEQEHQGGIVLYTYAQSSDTNYGLASFLDLGESANKTFRRFEGQVWYYYSKRLKALTQEYRNTPNTPIVL